MFYSIFTENGQLGKRAGYTINILKITKTHSVNFRTLLVPTVRQCVKMCIKFA